MDGGFNSLKNYLVDMALDFIVPGFPKCGTTWLYDRLCEMPQFDLPHHKELHYFNRKKAFSDGPKASVESYILNRKRLLRNFGYGGIRFFQKYLKIWKANDSLYKELFNEKERISGDITPVYVLLDGPKVRDMRNLIGDVKIIFIFRDPIERAWSQFRMIMRKRGIHDLAGIDNKEVISILNMDHLQRRGDYKRGYETFRYEFHKSEFHVGFYDHLQKDPQGFLGSMLRFLTAYQDVDLSKVKIKQRSNVSPRIEMPDEVYTYLKDTNFKQYEWLMSEFEQYPKQWYDKHYL